MSIIKIHEISMAVKDLEETIKDYEKLGFKIEGRGGSPEPPVMAKFAGMMVGGVALGFMESTAPGSPIDRFIKRRGEGIFSLSLVVSDMDEAMNIFKAQGIEFVLDKPQEMSNYAVAGGKTYRKAKFNFAKPCKATHGVLWELQEFQE
jgi:catechol 2,3-dioxygenase-like lactoylglutathione lyase family enzyme